MDITTIQKLAQLINSSGLSVLEVQEGDFRVRLEQRTHLSSEWEAHVGITPGAMPVITQPPVASIITAPAEAVHEKLHEITSPIVGIFFPATKLGREADVGPGDAVRKGQLLCAVEAMKLMNEIASDTDGVIVETMVEPGEMVEFGQVLFTLREGNV